jgi:hypothetical protein
MSYCLLLNVVAVLDFDYCIILVVAHVNDKALAKVTTSLLLALVVKLVVESLP